jgi:hypothetical protein
LLGFPIVQRMKLVTDEAVAVTIDGTVFTDLTATVLIRGFTSRKGIYNLTRRSDDGCTLLTDRSKVRVRSGEGI